MIHFADPLARQGPRQVLGNARGRRHCRFGSRPRMPVARHQRTRRHHRRYRHHERGRLRLHGRQCGDMEHFQEQMKSFDGDVCMDYLEDSMQFLALQGPGTAAAVSKLLPDGLDLTNMAFMTGTDTTLDGIEGCRITR